MAAVLNLFKTITRNSGKILVPLPDKKALTPDQHYMIMGYPNLIRLIYRTAMMDLCIM
jgi:hypothetical protein